MADHAENRSSAFSPEQLAAITAMTTACVQEAVKGIFAGLAPTLEGMALTPEKIRALNAPYTDPAKEARQKREMLLWKQDEEERLKNERAHKANCTHKDPKGQEAIRLIRNYPDRQTRGICVLCHDLITPKEWRIAAPDAEHPRGRAYLAEPHKDYMRVRQIEVHE